MAKIKDTRSFMRVTHRYLGFFMVGIMAMYSLSGILLIYRDTDFLKKEVKIEKEIAAHLPEKKLAKEVKIKNFEITKTVGEVLYFKQGSYNQSSGKLIYTTKELPSILKKITSLHKAQSKNRWSALNVIFGISLFFFVISSFWMFNVKSKVFKKGLVYSAFGLILAVVLIYFT